MSVANVGRVWQTARADTQWAAEKLPDVQGLSSVKDFVRRHPVVSTCAALVVAWCVMGGALPTVLGALSLVGPRR